MKDTAPEMIFADLLESTPPKAVAWIRGNTEYPQLNGSVKIFSTPYTGQLVEVEVYGLPDGTTPLSSGFYGMHIHENGDCTPPFDKTGGHYNPDGRQHPNHAGDMIPLISNQGYAWLSFYDERFSIAEIIGRSVIIHKLRDDFDSQPSGDAGEKIGCGPITSYYPDWDKDMSVLPERNNQQHHP